MRVRFGSCVLDSGAREVRRGDAAVHLSPKAFDVLEILVARRPNVVSKDILLEEVWPGKVVEEANLAIVVGEIRKALGDDPRAPAMVITALFSFMTAWNEYVIAAVVLQDTELFTLPVGLKLFQSQMNTQWGLYAAGSLIVSLPVVLLFLALSRYLISGLTLGAVGRGTTIEFVEVFNNSDDGVEFFGGTVNTRYMIMAFNEDEAFDIEVGA